MKGARALTDGELAALMMSAPNRERTLVCILAYTGARLSEALDLRWGDVSETTVHFRRATTKGRRAGRVVPLHTALLHELRRHGSDGELHWPEQAIIAGEDGRSPLSRSAATRSIRAAMDAAEIPPPVSSHSLRKWYAQSLLRGGGSVHAVSQLLGHSALSSTQRYLCSSTLDELEDQVATLPTVLR